MLLCSSKLSPAVGEFPRTCCEFLNSVDVLTFNFDSLGSALLTITS